MSLGIAVFIAIGVLALATLGGVLWFVRDSNKRIQGFAKSTDLVPGKPGRAPAEWATSTEPEALLHQRLRYAIADVHSANQAVAVPVPPDSAAAADPTDLDDLDDAVFALDDRLIAAAQLTGEDRTKATAELAPKVASLESLTGKLWEAPASRRGELLNATVSALRR
ncbi:hypothetical protein [Tsukamurella sp. 1534]|uniref:hypothetical protein n=1 Tax=Tsukamurella sp. 1534 TaxID=1151061 RepID=UPI0002F874AC|nr:hypothetical protein [Tsukamurella sp. 1534]